MEEVSEADVVLYIDANDMGRKGDKILQPVYMKCLRSRILKKLCEFLSVQHAAE